MTNDDHHLLARYRRNTQAARIITDATTETNKPITEAHHHRDPVDAIRLRGIPCLAPGTNSTIRGTAPHTLPFLTPSERSATLPPGR